MRCRPGYHNGNVSAHGMGCAKPGALCAAKPPAFMHYRGHQSKSLPGAQAYLGVSQLLFGCPSGQISRTYTHYGATMLFLYFGARMLYDVATGADSVRCCDDPWHVHGSLHGPRTRQW